LLRLTRGCFILAKASAGIMRPSDATSGERKGHVQMVDVLVRTDDDLVFWKTLR
jgi:hypothetical protein